MRALVGRVQDKFWYWYWLFYGLNWLEIQYPELAEKR